MNKKNKKGFTIIELIVVIAIIAVLAAIVLVNVTQYINKSKDAAVKGNMTTIMTNAAIFFDDSTKGNGTYTGFDSDSLYIGPKSAITSANAAPTPNVSASAYCVKAALKDTTTYPNGWCVDSTGFSGPLTSGKCAGSSYSCTQ